MNVQHDGPLQIQHHSIIVGQVFASREPAMVTTVLGSCVAACLFDSARAIGGMNHFMLPESSQGRSSAAFGIHAMELLINKLMQLGCEKHRLQAKIFGGGKVLSLQGEQMQIGQRNVKFICDFLTDESIPLVAKRVGGSTGVKLCFFTHTAKAMVKPLPSRWLGNALESEVSYMKSVCRPGEKRTDAIDLFE